MNPYPIGARVRNISTNWSSSLIDVCEDYSKVGIEGIIENFKWIKDFSYYSYAVRWDNNKRCGKSHNQLELIEEAKEDVKSKIMKFKVGDEVKVDYNHQAGIHCRGTIEAIIKGEDHNVCVVNINPALILGGCNIDYIGFAECYLSKAEVIAGHEVEIIRGKSSAEDKLKIGCTQINQGDIKTAARLLGLTIKE